MSWQQVVIIVWFALTLGVSLVMDGQPKTGKHSFVSDLIGVLILAAILYTGGFWS